MKNINAVGWFEIYVDDIDRAKKFYEQVLDVQLSGLHTNADPYLTMYGFPMIQGAANATGAIVKMDGVKAGGNSTIAYFSCEDCATEESRVEKNGCKVFKPKMEIGNNYGFMSLCYDSEGNIFGLHSMK